MGNCYLIVIDGMGCGAQEDAARYGDEEMNTLAHVCERTGCRLPNLQRLGLGNIVPLASVDPDEKPLCAWGRMRERSPGKDSTTGHWELAGIHLDDPFPTYPEGFPPGVIESFCRIADQPGVLCNRPASGTRVIRQYGEEHLRSGRPIVYTSADSVFQVAAHVEVTPVERLYAWCREAREEVLRGKHGVGRVIARPFEGGPGAFERLDDRRHDFSLTPPEPNLLSHLRGNGIRTYSIGKVVDLFGESLFTQYRRTADNAEGISQLLSLMSAARDSFVFVNLIDTDQKYGHRLDPEGFARSLQEFDRAVPAIFSKLGKGDLLMITGDHGNDPTSESTDHSREFVPILLSPGPPRALGVRESFSDVAATACRFFGLETPFPGSPMG